MSFFKVKGKFVFCKFMNWGVDFWVKGIGGIGVIVLSELFLDIF